MYKVLQTGDKLYKYVVYLKSHSRRYYLCAHELAKNRINVKFVYNHLHDEITCAYTNYRKIVLL